MKVSVLVPVYGVEKYIERCAVSLFEQTHRDMEYVFVNDCTPDRSISILRSVIERYPDRAPQVRIIDNEVNRGVGLRGPWPLLPQQANVSCMPTATTICPRGL